MKKKGTDRNKFQLIVKKFCPHTAEISRARTGIGKLWWFEKTNGNLGLWCILFFANNQCANNSRNPGTKCEKKYYYYWSASFIDYSQWRKNYTEDYTPDWHCILWINELKFSKSYNAFDDIWNERLQELTEWKDEHNWSKSNKCWKWGV